MINEYLSLFFTCYLYATLILTPLFLLYSSIDFRKVSLPLIMGLHKTLLIATICLPIAILITSAPSSQVGQETILYQGTQISPVAGQDSQIQPLLDNIVSTDTYNSPTDNYYPGVQDIIFYFSELLGVLSILGFAVFWFRFTLQSLHLNKIENGGETSIIQNGITLICSAEVSSPFSVGLLKKRIFIPYDMGASKENIILQHELNHFSCRHHLWSIAETIMSYLFWFNPASNFLKKRGDLYREMECDRKTILNVDKFEYSRVLIESAESILPNNAGGITAHNWIEKDALRNRIEAILGEKGSYRRWIFNFILCLSIGLTGFLFFSVGNINSDFLESEILETINRDYAETINSREVVDISKVPPVLIKALVVHEDGSFYRHSGLSVTGIIRAVGSSLKSYISGGPVVVSGGSTITQQLAKNFLREEKSLKRKVKELKVARVLEKHFNKNQILEMYLNRVYFGNGAWGLSEASRKYFNKSYVRLTRNDSAMLIPFLKAPAKYNLIDSPTIALKRQGRLLKRMAEAGSKE